MQGGQGPRGPGRPERGTPGRGTYAARRIVAVLVILLLLVLLVPRACQALSGSGGESGSVAPEVVEPGGDSEEESATDEDAGISAGEAAEREEVDSRSDGEQAGAEGDIDAPVGAMEIGVDENSVVPEVEAAVDLVRVAGLGVGVGEGAGVPAGPANINQAPQVPSQAAQVPNQAAQLPNQAAQVPNQAAQLPNGGINAQQPTQPIVSGGPLPFGEPPPLEQIAFEEPLPFGEPTPLEQIAFEEPVVFEEPLAGSAPTVATTEGVVSVGDGSGATAVVGGVVASG